MTLLVPMVSVSTVINIIMWRQAQHYTLLGGDMLMMVAAYQLCGISLTWDTGGLRREQNCVLWETLLIKLLFALCQHLYWTSESSFIILGCVEPYPYVPQMKFIECHHECHA